MLVRPETTGSFSVYLTRRSARSRFMPGAFVFPGGAVDEADRTLARSERLRGRAGRATPELAVAALRELFEEAGILIASNESGVPIAYSASELEALRAEHLAAGSFAALLERHALVLRAEALAYYSNWITPQSEPIRFDAHFFIARAPAGQIAAADAVEVHDGVWLRAAEALEAAGRGEMTIQFPTQRHLERLARFTDIDPLFSHARARTVTPVMPLERDGGDYTFDRDAW